MKLQLLISTLLLTAISLSEAVGQEENLNLHLKCKTVQVIYEKNFWGKWKEIHRGIFDPKVHIENNTFQGIPLRVSDRAIMTPLLYGGHLTSGDGGETRSSYVDSFFIDRMTGKIEYWERLINLPDNMPDRKWAYTGSNCKPYTPSEPKKLF